jgi:BNR repeat-like domain
VRRGRLLLALSLLALALVSGATGAGGWRAPIALGYPGGDDWEPAIAADDAGNVYVLWKHYSVGTDCGVPCDRKETLQVSRDGGATWSPPAVFDPVVGFDSQIEVDPLNQNIVWASYLSGSKDTVARKSTDYGESWSAPIQIEDLNKYTDKDILAVRGETVSIAYNHAQAIYASTTHDGGSTWETVKINQQQSGQLGWSLPSGGGIDAQGRIFFAWSGYEGNGGPNGPVNLYVTRSTDGGLTWKTTLLMRAADTPDCNCSGWAYWGAQTALVVEPGGAIDVPSNANTSPGAPNRLFFQRSTDHGVTFSDPRELAANGSMHLFPAITSAGSGDVRIAWMDNRTGAFRVYYETSGNGGGTWSPATAISGSFASGYGDYFELAVGAGGSTHAVWGEGPSYDGPGRIFYWSKP